LCRAVGQCHVPLVPPQWCLSFNNSICPGLPRSRSVVPLAGFTLLLRDTAAAAAAATKSGSSYLAKCISRDLEMQIRVRSNPNLYVSCCYLEHARSLGMVTYHCNAESLECRVVVYTDGVSVAAAPDSSAINAVPSGCTAATTVPWRSCSAAQNSADMCTRPGSELCSIA
jgi:hypothetical protein